MITPEHLKGLPGLSRVAQAALIGHQPKTVLEALRLRGIGRCTTRKLLALELITDPEGVQGRAIHEAERALGRRL